MRYNLYIGRWKNVYSCYGKMKEILALIYKTWYNYYLKKDGDTNWVLPILCSMLTWGVIALFLFNVICVIRIMLGLPITHKGISRGEGVVVLYSVTFCFYLLLFYILKIEKYGDDNDTGLFLMDPDTYKKIWRGIIINLIVLAITMIYVIANTSNKQI